MLPTVVRPLWFGIFVFIAIVSGCNDDAGSEGTTSGTTSGGDVDATTMTDSGATTGPDLDDPLLTADDMFSLEHLPRFDITLGPEAMAALAVEPKVYVPGGFRYLDQDFPNVGVRLKGNISLTTLAEKPSIKIKINEYDQNQRFLGVKKLTFHNMHQDASMMHEHLGYKIFRGLGVPASRTGYAVLYINGEAYGVYLNVETPDDIMLDRAFADGNGNLYEGEHHDDIDGSPDGWEQDEGDDVSRADLELLRQRALEADETLFFGPTAPLDTPRVLAFLFGEAYVGHFDGYWVSHNFFIYHELATDKWTLMPWSLDQTFVRKVDAFDGGGYIKELCLGIPGCLQGFVNTGLVGLDLIAALDLPGEMDRVLYVIDEAARLDERKRHSNSKMERSQESLREWVNERPAAVRERIDCLVDGIEPDADLDGFGACFRDCNDLDPNVNPDAEETCHDAIDNDCSGFPDDIPACPCPAADFDGATFYFCPQVIRWRDAEQFCRDQDHELAYFDTRAQNDLVAAHAEQIAHTRWAIGLNDRSVENTYLWTTGEPPTFLAWADGEPAHRLEWFDCIFLSSSGSGSWQELNCIQSGPFICR